MRVLEIITKAIGKLWGFLHTIIIIGLVISFLLFIVTVFMPDNVVRAIEIIKGL